MKARTLGPILMMTLGAAITLAPAAASVGAVDQDLCEYRGRAEISSDCCGTLFSGFVDPCEPLNTVIVTLPTPSTVVTSTTAAVVPSTTAAVVTSPTTAAVVVPSTTDIGSGGQGLPATGSTSNGYVALGGLLLIAGAGLLVLGRRTTNSAAN